MMQRGGWLKTRDRWYRVQVEWEPVSEWWEREREAAMFAYVTFRMTLAGHTGLLPHQFYRCPRGHHITHSLSLSSFLSMSLSLSPTSAPPPPPPHTLTHTYAQPQATWLYLAEHTRSLRLAAESQQHSPCSPASETLLGNREAAALFPLQATAAAPLWSPTTPSKRRLIGCPTTIYMRG